MEQSLEKEIIKLVHRLTSKKVNPQASKRGKVIRLSSDTIDRLMVYRYAGETWDKAISRMLDENSL